MRKTLYPNHPYANAVIRTPADSKGRLKQNQSGMTLVEVLVAMFVLAVGVLALLATQLRTVSSVREAESQTVVAQAVQNLMEGMQINPVLSEETKNGEKTGWVKKRYDDGDTVIPGSGKAASYRFSSPKKIAACSGTVCKTTGEPQTNPLNKREILDYQLAYFEDSLKKALPNSEAWYIICNDDSGRDMTISGSSVSKNCTDDRSDPLVIKVLWQVDSEQANAASAVKSNGSNIVYTYQARMPDN